MIWCTFLSKYNRLKKTLLDLIDLNLLVRKMITFITSIISHVHYIPKNLEIEQEVL